MMKMNSISSPMKAESGASARQRGFALVIVLWIFIVLIAVGAEFSGAMREDVSATRNFAGETKSYYLATAAANRTFYRALIARDEAKLDMSLDELKKEFLDGGEFSFVLVDGQWHEQMLWGQPVWVKVDDESGKIPINLAGEGVLRHVLGNLGLDAAETDEITAAILDWRDDDDDVRVNGAESDYYLDRPRPYVAKNARLDSLEELLLIKGISAELYRGGSEDFPIGLKEIFTVFNPRPALNVRSSPREVLQALFGFDEQQVDEFLAARAAGGLDLFSLAETMLPDPQLADMMSDEPPNVLKVSVQAQTTDSPVAAHVAAVIDLGESNEGVYILRWYDQLPAVEIQKGRLFVGEEVV